MRRAGITYAQATEHVSRLTKDAIDQYAATSADVLSLKPGGDLAPLVELLGGRTHVEDPFSPLGEENTIYVHGPRDFDIILSFASGPRRDRFTIAHELAHYLLHSQQGEIPLVASRLGSNRAEWEANWFAAGFLMPAVAFKNFMRQHNSDITSVANHFGVSEAAARVRKETLGL